MTKTLLVVGDSYMKTDERCPGQHWSEMLSEYHVINLAGAGNSLAMIQFSLYQGLAQHCPDAVVVGFTDPLRIEFGKDNIYTSCHVHSLTSDQKIATKYWHATLDLDFQAIKGCMQMLSMLDLLFRHQIPYAYSLGNFKSFVGHMPQVLLGQLERHSLRQTTMELANYRPFKASPVFHVDDPVWQQRYAQSVREILTT